MSLRIKQSFFLSLMICSSGAIAGSSTPALGLSGGLEYFHLEEIDSAGARLLSESGYRYVISTVFDNMDRYNIDTPLLYHLEAAAYLGQVNYDGHTQSLTLTQTSQPFNSKTEYQGGRTEALLGYRFKPSILPRPLELLVGLGFDGWNRNIKGGATADGSTLVSGSTEVYYVYYGKLALGMADPLRVSWHNHLQIGVKMPFSINEDVKLRAVGFDKDLSLSPGNTYSGFVKLTLESQPAAAKSGNLLVSIYYDGTRFDPSPSKTATQNGNPIQVWQPETHIDNFGVQIGYRF